MKILGIILIVGGLLMVFFRGLTFTHEKEVADLGPIELNKKEKKTVSWPLYAGIAVAVCGVVVLIASNSKKTSS